MEITGRVSSEWKVKSQYDVSRLDVRSPMFTLTLHLLETTFRGGDALGQIIAKYDNVERVVAGQVHCHTQRRFHGTIAITCPSTTLNVHTNLN